MKSRDEPNPSRREFFRHVGRYGAAAALVGGVSLLVLRDPAAACDGRSPCGSCREFGGCALPQAQASRAANGGEHG